MPGVRGRPIGTCAGRARLFLSLRIQHGFDAAGALRARRGVRGDRAAAAIDRERVGSGPGRVHVRRAAGAGSGRSCACCFARRPGRSAGGWAISPRSCAGRRSKATIRAAGISTSRWSTRKSGRNLFMPEREHEYLSPLGRAFLGGLMKHAGACTPFATPTVNGYRRYRPNSLAPDRATWCYDHRGVMIRVLGGPERSGHPDGEPDRRACREPLPLYPLADRGRARRHREQARAGTARRRSLQCQPAHAARELAGRAWMRSSANRSFAPNSARCSSTISSSSSATRPGGLRNGARTPASRRVTSRPSGSRTSISIFSRRMHYSVMRTRAELGR